MVKLIKCLYSVTGYVVLCSPIIGTNQIDLAILFEDLEHIP